MKRIFVQLLMVLMLVGGGASLRAAVAAGPFADVSIEQTSATPVDLLATTANAEESGVTSDLHAETHLSDATPGSPRHRVTLDDSGGTVAVNSTSNGQQAGIPHVPEPSSQTAVYLLGGAIGLGLVVMRRRGRSPG